MLPGNPYRVSAASAEQDAAGTAKSAVETARAPDPTLLKPQETNPFSGS